jgi:hypothetical protein
MKCNNEAKALRVRHSPNRYKHVTDKCNNEAKALRVRHSPNCHKHVTDKLPKH